MSGAPRFRETNWKQWLSPGSLTDMRQELREVVDRFLGEPLSQLRGTEFPRVDIVETDDAVEVTCELPGYQREELQVLVDEKSLLISGTPAGGDAAAEEGRKFLRSERQSGSFSRTLWFPCPVNENAVVAKLHNGLLRVSLPKQHRSQRRPVDIQTEPPQPSAGV